MKSDALDEKKPAAVAESSASGALSTVDTDGDSTVTPEEDADTAKQEVEEPVPEGGHAKEKSKHLIGKINNLLTSDMTTISSAQDMIFIR